MAALRGILDSSAIMAQKRPLPRICIALGLPDVPTLLEHARREAEAGETFLEFRLDYLRSAGQRRRRHPRLPGAVPGVHHPRHLPPPSESRHDSTAASKSNCACSISPFRTARTPSISRSKPPRRPRDKLHQFSGRAHVIVSYHNFETTPPLDPS